ncbi:MAG: peptidoglycan editing factor PgeF [Ruminococcus sp.]|nr:peptidoglycan editing factor PgeF [Ruminococcus sp.]
MIFESNVLNLNNYDTVPYLTYKSLENIDFITHGFSTRLGGVSEGIFSSMNLAFNRGDNPDCVVENYHRICDSIGLDFDTLVASAQDHNTFVRAVTRDDCGVGITKPRDLDSVDALVTNEKNVTLVTYYADCTPLFFVDKNKKVIALAHAGWRGTVGKIGEKVINKMTEQFNCNPEDIVCAVGPAISKCCYEVDENCAEQFYALKELDSSKFIFPVENNKFMIDLLETNKQILINAGVPESNISVSDVCTKCNSELLWSHRATNGQRGTMCAFMCMK